MAVNQAFLNENPKNDIRVVAKYNRKSRGDSEEDLVKHNYILTEMCKRNNWKYVDYPEIGSGDSIELRPVFQRLLQDIEEGLFDAVLVVDWDRLGRGDMGDTDRIKKALKRSNTLVITPGKWYDLDDDDDDFNVDAKAFIARQEYKMIKFRLNRGKKIGARLGRWTNGTPPFPYDYDPQRKSLIVNENKHTLYRFIIEAALEGHVCDEIAWELNKQGFPSPRNKKWTGTTISRLLRDETHLGKIISNKSEGNGHLKKMPSAKQFKKFPKHLWVVVDNCHQPVKTQEEHNKLLYALMKRKKVPVAARAGKHALSGLVRCAICNSSLPIYRSPKNSSRIRACQHRDHYGNKCTNKGGFAEIIIQEIHVKLMRLEDQIVNRIKDEEGDDFRIIQDAIQQKYREIKQREEAIERIEEGFEAGVYTANRARTRKIKLESELDTLHEELAVLEKQSISAASITDEERLFFIREFWRTMQSSEQDNHQELNKCYKEVISSISWKKEENGPASIEINFL
ncbi:recombinase family protein [Paenibacillus sp. S150]|uniref:recombinase family protein n=1 Tax=Paenibacillus sp. S150 TaxID=2749826 RepID=UPI001C56C81A|nr:recombinase family protein [Paenibacillus sp. S150]MBW4081316.1 recombinase family protein [Paenibacillus sp. S150]